MHFVTNTINTKSKVPTLAEIYKAARTQAALDKTASTNGTVKVAANIAQVQKEIRQAGEPGKGNAANLTAPKFGPGGKKTKNEKEEKPEKEVVESCTCGKKGCKTCNASKIAQLQRQIASYASESEKEEGETSGQPQAEAKLVNDPNKDPKLTEGKKGGSKGTPESEEAESSGQLDVEPLHQKGESTDEKPGSLNTQKTDKKEAKTVANALKKTARFKRFSELTPKQKEYLRGVYSIYWPKDFIDALLASK